MPYGLLICWSENPATSLPANVDTDLAGAAARELTASARSVLIASRRRISFLALGLRGPDVFVDVLRQHVERHVPAEHQRVIEGLEIVPLSERRLRPLALAIDLTVPDLVAA